MLQWLSGGMIQSSKLNMGPKFGPQMWSTNLKPRTNRSRLEAPTKTRTRDENANMPQRVTPRLKCCDRNVTKNMSHTNKNNYLHIYYHHQWWQQMNLEHEFLSILMFLLFVQYDLLSHTPHNQCVLQRLLWRVKSLILKCIFYFRILIPPIHVINMRIFLLLKLNM